MASSTNHYQQEQKQHSLSWVYSFEELDTLETTLRKECGRQLQWSDVKSVLGGKGAGLADMARIGIPVPPGFSITTRACIAFQENSRRDNNNNNNRGDNRKRYENIQHYFPSNLWQQIVNGIHQMERKMNKKFGGKDDPLLVSVRSGAPISMPGMMDTILNLGINPTTAQGIATRTNDPRFAWDSYRRFVQMFSKIVLGIDEEKLKECRNKEFEDMDVDEIKDTVSRIKEIVSQEMDLSNPIPDDPWKQLEMAVVAVFSSWNGKRAQEYRRLNQISDRLGTAVTVQTMVFGNMMGRSSATGVAFTRNPATGENKLYGEFLINAQGEDVVAGIRTPEDIESMKEWNEKVYNEFVKITRRLEEHYRDMQDMEFTIEGGKLWMLQTRSGKRSGVAAVRVAVEMVHEKVLQIPEALERVDPAALNQLLHPIIDPEARVDKIAIGNPASPGAAYGQLVFSPEDAERLSQEGKNVIMARTETSPEDVNGLALAKGLVTSHGGMTSHAAVVARSMGKPCVTGVSTFDVRVREKIIRLENGDQLNELDEITIDGTTGNVMRGKAPVKDPELSGYFAELMEWTSQFQKLQVWTNADTSDEVETAMNFGAEGIGLVRTEHMFFQPERIIHMQRMIMSDEENDRRECLKEVLELQRQDFEDILRAVKGKPVTIRTLDPPLHEFLPQNKESMDHLASRLNISTIAIEKKLDLLKEANPMLGLRGCRLGIKYPEITEMQAKAIAQAAVNVGQEETDHKVIVEVMIPFVSDVREFSIQADLVRTVTDSILATHPEDLRQRVVIKVGTMIELPRAALLADEIAQEAEFFSFGTNDLTQTVFGISRDDSGLFLQNFIKRKILDIDPFTVLDQKGVGKLVSMATELGRKTRKNLQVGICGEHGGDPSSVKFCSGLGMDYVSCSPFRVPIARLAAAQASLSDK